MYSIIASFHANIILINNPTLSIPRVIGMVLGSCLLGFLIGSMFALMAVSVVRANHPVGEFPVKRTMLIGGISGAVIGSIVLLYFIYN